MSFKFYQHSVFMKNRVADVQAARKQIFKEIEEALVTKLPLHFLKNLHNINNTHLNVMQEEAEIIMIHIE